MAEILAAPDADEGKEPSVKTIDRAARVLRALAAGGRGGMALTDIARMTDFGKGTTHRLLSALIDAGFVFQDTGSRRYRLGAGFAILARTAFQQDSGALAKPFIERIAKKTEDTVYVSVREGTGAVCVGRETGAFPIRTLTLDVGDRRPLGVGSGALALLAAMPDSEIDDVVARNQVWLRQFPGYSAAYLRTAVADSRRRGYAFVDGKRIAGMNAIGVAVLDAAGKPIAALSVAAIVARVSGDRIPELVAILKKEAAELAHVLAEPVQAATRQRERA